MGANAASGPVAATNHHAGHQAGSADRGLTTADLRHDAGRELPGPAAENRSDGGSKGDLVSTHEGGHVMCIRGAAQEPEEGDVEDVRQLPRLQAEVGADPESDQACPESLLERLSHAEIRGQGQGTDELSQPQPPRQSLHQLEPSTERKKDRSSAFSRSAASTWARWPAPSRTTSREPSSCAWRSCATVIGERTSRAPQMRRIGTLRCLSSWRRSASAKA